MKPLGESIKKVLLLLDESMDYEPLLVMGLDLAGSPKRSTGYAFLNLSLEAEVGLVYTDDEIINLAKARLPKAIAIDAPLFLPRGRGSLEERSAAHLRDCDKELLRRGIKFFPVTLGPMRALTKRGMALSAALKALGFVVVETFPGGAQDVMSIPRRKDLLGLRRGLESLGVKAIKAYASEHELDALTCALVAYLYLIGEVEALGSPDEGFLYLPKHGGLRSRELNR